VRGDGVALSAATSGCRILLADLDAYRLARPRCPTSNPPWSKPRSPKHCAGPGDHTAAQIYAEESVRTGSTAHPRGQVHRYAGLSLMTGPVAPK
jgi:hypothetical protein